MEIAIVFPPLIGAIIAGFFGRFIGDKRIVDPHLGFAITISAVLSWIIFYEIIFGGTATG